MQFKLSKKIIITSKFNIMTGARNNYYSKSEKLRFDTEWIENRMDIFVNFTLKSFKNQTNQDFSVVYAIDDSTEDLVNNALKKYDPLPSNIMFVKKSDYMNTLDKLSDGYHLLYLTRLDSDDMYCKDFIETLHNFPTKIDTQELICQHGYMYDSKDNRLADYRHTCFTYYTFIYKKYKEVKKYDSFPLDPMQLLVDFSHFSTMNYKYEAIPGRNFIYHIHGNNAASTFYVYDFGHVKVERIIEDEKEKEAILSRFFK